MISWIVFILHRKICSIHHTCMTCLFISFLLIYKTRPNDFDLQLGCCISDVFSIFSYSFWKVLLLLLFFSLQIWWKKGNNSKMGNQKRTIQRNLQHKLHKTNKTHTHNTTIRNQTQKIEKASEMQQPSCKSKSFGLVL